MFKNEKFIKLKLIFLKNINVSEIFNVSLKFLRKPINNRGISEIPITSNIMQKIEAIHIYI